MEKDVWGSPTRNKYVEVVDVNKAISKTREQVGVEARESQL